MLTDRIVCQDGQFIPWDQATVHMMCHSFGRGTAIFEVISLHDAQDGPAIFRLDAHADRLLRSVSLLGLELALDRRAIMDLILETVRQNGCRQGYIKVLAAFPQVVLDLTPPDGPLSLNIFVLDPAKDLPAGFKPKLKQTKVCLSSWRKLDPQTVPIEAKASANYLNGFMAKTQARRRGFDNALMLDTQGFVAEGGTEAFFFVNDGRIYTAAAGTILRSISRQSILDVAVREGLDLVETRLSRDFVEGVDEMFQSSTAGRVQPISQLDDRKLEPCPGPATARLAQLVDDIEHGRAAGYEDWLFPV